jgi:O-acetyl-ADP-ribose deacetylase (regulator of RNase III)
LVPVGLAVITTAGNLPSKAVIPTAGPIMGEGNEDYKLRKAVRGSLLLASKKGFRSISMPAISYGILVSLKIDVQRYLLKNPIPFFKLVIIMMMIMVTTRKILLQH